MRQFRNSTGRSARDQVWFIGRDPKDKTSYITKWGLLDGVLQETRDAPGPCGTVGHADYQTAEEYVDFCIDREIRKKREQGYVEYIDDKPIEKVATFFSFASILPKNMCFYKPQKCIADEKLKDLEQGGNAIWTLKRDGMMHIAYKTDSWNIYSRRMDLVTEKYPHIIESLNKLNIPSNTILLGEFVLPKRDGTDNFVGVSKICRSDRDLSLAYQGIITSDKVEVLGKILYYVFDVAFYNGKD